jgi:hypothetical protein
MAVRVLGSKPPLKSDAANSPSPSESPQSGGLKGVKFILTSKRRRSPDPRKANQPVGSLPFLPNAAALIPMPSKLPMGQLRCVARSSQL